MMNLTYYQCPECGIFLQLHYEQGIRCSAHENEDEIDWVEVPINRVQITKEGGSYNPYENPVQKVGAQSRLIDMVDYFRKVGPRAFMEETTEGPEQLLRSEFLRAFEGQNRGFIRYLFEDADVLFEGLHSNPVPVQLIGHYRFPPKKLKPIAHFFLTNENTWAFYLVSDPQNVIRTEQRAFRLATKTFSKLSSGLLQYI